MKRRHIVARADELPVGGRLIASVAGRSIGVFNVDGELFAIRNRCPHQGAELCKGRVVDPPTRSPEPGVFIQEGGSPFLQCPWHGWEFDLRTGASWFDPAKMRVRAYAVAVEPMGDGDALPADQDAGASAGRAAGPGGRELQAETYAVDVEDSYIVVTL